MRTVWTIFRYEWKLFVRQPVSWISLLVFVLLGLYSVREGRQLMDHQWTVIDSIQTVYQRDLQIELAKFPKDTLAAGKSAGSQAIPEVVDFRIPPNAIHFPAALAHLSIGQRDLQPYYEKVRRGFMFAEDAGSVISHPARLAAGNTDLAFVMIYLLPLLIIAFHYNLIAQDRESGTYALLRVQRGRLSSIVTARLLFRFVILSIPVMLINVTGLLMAPSPARMSFAEGACWLGVILAYQFFWFGLCYCMVRLQRSSTVTALAMMSTWLLLLIVLPALINIFITWKHPVPLRADLASYERAMSEEIWEMPRGPLIDSFYHYHPQYRQLRRVSDTAEYGSKRFAAYYDLLERRVLEKATALEDTIRQRNRLNRKIGAFDPALLAQQLLNKLAATGWEDQERYQQQVRAFRGQWKNFLNDFILREQHLSAADFRQFPVFHDPADPQMLRTTGNGIVIICCAGLFLFAMGTWMPRFREPV